MINFIFYTDCPIDKFPTYDNVHFIKTTFEDYCHLVGKRLGIEYNISNPYKLTDLKPFLGAIHREELKEYNFWSFGDIDLCYGDLSIIINESNLSKYDVLTTHNYHIAGHFTLIRNNDYYRNLCFQISDWQSKLVDDEHKALDEGEWSKQVYPGLYWGRLFWKRIFRYLHFTNFFTFMNVYNNMVNKKQLFREYYTSPAPKRSALWIYDIENGKIYDKLRNELPYLHFLFFKKTPWLETTKYWQSGYYEIKNSIEKYSKITISLDGIKGEMHE